MGDVNTTSAAPSVQRLELLVGSASSDYAVRLKPCCISIANRIHPRGGTRRHAECPKAGDQIPNKPLRSIHIPSFPVPAGRAPRYGHGCSVSNRRAANPRRPGSPLLGAHRACWRSAPVSKTKKKKRDDRDSTTASGTVAVRPNGGKSKPQTTTKAKSAPGCSAAADATRA